MNQDPNQLWYFKKWESRKWRWFGYMVTKYPADLMTYQEIIFANKPDLLIETGTCRGGSALFFASVFDSMGHGQVVSIDSHAKNQPAHPRVTYINGRSTSVETLETVARIADGKVCMVSLDSDHHQLQVKRELKHYSPFVTVGQYLVVEDTLLDKMAIRPSLIPGPSAAVEWFLSRTNEFVQDREIEFAVTLNPGGYLRRVSRA